MKQNNTLEFLKFFAVLLITNSHFGSLYGRYSALATGGAIGNALFFFCSGYGLSMSRFDRFDNWYKRRIFRVMPSIVSVGILCSILGLKTNENAVYQMFIGGGEWFFLAIMLFFVAIYLLQFIIDIKHMKPKYYMLAFVFIFIITTLAAFFTIDNRGMLYSGTTYKESWPGYFSTMLLGFVYGKESNNNHFVSRSPIVNILVLIISIVFYYGILYWVQRSGIPSSIGIFSLVPLYIILISGYGLTNCNCFENLYNSKLWFFFKLIASLCWEIYLVQMWIVFKYTETLNTIVFPFNIIACLVLIILSAYVVKVFSRLIVQLFNPNSFDWISIVKVWNR